MPKMKSLLIALSLLLFLAMCTPVYAASASGDVASTDPKTGAHRPPQKAIDLNNQATAEINKSHFDAAITMLLEALALDPQYSYGRTNLSIAHNNYAIALSNKGDLRGALKHLHHAGFVAPSTERQVNSENTNATISALQYDPKKASDRVKLGDESLQAGDLISAIVEYRNALKLEPDQNIQAKLDQAIARLKVTDKLMSEVDAGH